MFKRRSIAAVAVTVLAVSCAPPAHADPVVDYTKQLGLQVCALLDAEPSFLGVNMAASAIHSAGFTFYQAGEAIAVSVNAYCPRHAGLLRAYVNAANPGRVV